MAFPAKMRILKMIDFCEVNRVVEQHLSVCTIKCSMDGVFVEVGGLNILLVIEMMIKLMMGLMVDDVFSLVLVS